MHKPKVRTSGGRLFQRRVAILNMVKLKILLTSVTAKWPPPLQDVVSLVLLVKQKVTKFSFISMTHRATCILSRFTIFPAKIKTTKSAFTARQYLFYQTSFWIFTKVLTSDSRLLITEYKRCFVFYFKRLFE